MRRLLETLRFERPLRGIDKNPQYSLESPAEIRNTMAAIQFQNLHLLNAFIAALEVTKSVTSETIQNLSTGILFVTSRIDTDDLRGNYFVTVLESSVADMKPENQEAVVLLARKVQETLVCFDQYLSPPKKIRIEDLSEIPTDDRLTKALADGNLEEIRERVNSMVRIEAKQLNDLFVWAQMHWKADFLNFILEKWELPIPLSDELIKTSLKEGKFLEIANALMLHQYSSLSLGGQWQIQSWLNKKSGDRWEKIAFKLMRLKTLLIPMTQKNGNKPVDIPLHGRTTSKSDVKPIMRDIVSMLSQLQEEKNLDPTCHRLWNTFCDSSNTEEFEKMGDMLDTLCNIFSAAAPSQSRPIPIGECKREDIGEWTEIPIIESDEKSNRGLFEEVQDAIRGIDSKKITTLLFYPEARRLSESDFERLIHCAIDTELQLLAFILTSPYVPNKLKTRYAELLTIY